MRTHAPPQQRPREVSFLPAQRPGEPQGDLADAAAPAAPAAAGRQPRTAALREALYRHAIGGREAERARAAHAAEWIAAAIAGGGAPLPPAVKRRLESVLQADLERVRVHTGPAADRAAASVGGRAFAIGDDLVFADGAYAPDTPGGDWLLAHEATHAARHRGGPGVADDPAAEAEASAVADAYVGSGRAPAPAHVAAVRELLGSAGVEVEPAAVDRLAVQYGTGLGLTRWSLGAGRQDAAQRVVALIAHAHAHQCGPGCGHRPRVSQLDAQTRAAVERSTGVALGEVAVERGADLAAGRLGEAQGSTIRLAPDASGDDALARKVLVHEAVHVAQGRVPDAGGPAPADRTAAVEAEAHTAADAVERGEPRPLSVKADPARPYGFDLGDVMKALGLDPMQFLRDHFPQVAGFFQNGFGPLLQQIGDAAGSVVQGVFERLGVADLQRGFDAITRSFQPGGLAFGILNGCCECLDHALRDLMQAVQGALDSNVAQTIRGWIARTQDAENNSTIDQITDFFAALKAFGGPVLAGIQQVGAWIEQADAAIGQSVVWKAIAPLFGLDPGLAPIEAIKAKMSQMWDGVKAGVAAIQHGLAQLWAAIEQDPVVAAILKFAGDCGKLVDAIRQVQAAKSRDPKVWLGILARELKGTVFEGLVSSLSSGYATTVALDTAITQWFTGILQATGVLDAFNAAVPYLNAIGRAIQGFAHTIQTTIQSIQAAIGQALAAAAKALKDLWTQVAPYVNFVVGLGLAIALTMTGDILAIPAFVVGQLWLHVLPECYKESLATFLLDLFIKLVAWFPARTPIMILARSAALSFLRTIQAAPMAQKIGAMNTIAKVMSNDLQVVAGFLVGLVKGLWNSSLGFLVQMAVLPFQLAWDGLQAAGKQLDGLGGHSFASMFDGASWLAHLKPVHAGGGGGGGGAAAPQPAAGGGAAPHSAPGTKPASSSAPPTVTTPVHVDPSAPPSGGNHVDTPDSGTRSGQSGSPATTPHAAPSAQPAPAPGPKSTPVSSVLDGVPAFPALPPLRDLLDPIFRQGITREQVEAMFKKFNIAMERLGASLGKQGADKLLPYLSAGSAPFDIGEIIGEVIGWLAGEIIMLVFTDGIENAISKFVEGAMDGGRIVAKIAELFPKLADWLLEMRKAIEPLIEAVEKIAAKAKEFLERVLKWVDEMIGWFKRQWEKLLKWIEETFGDLGKGGKKLAKTEEELEVEAEALEAANQAFERLDVQLVKEAVPLTTIEAKLRELAVAHTPDVQIHLHLITTEDWRIEATAIKGDYRGVGLSVGRGAVLWTYDTMIPYYTASGHNATHEALLDRAATQLETAAQAQTKVHTGGRDIAAAYQRVGQLARTTQEEYQSSLPVQNTQFLIKLEPLDSHDVRDLGYSMTEFIITPNAARIRRRTPISASLSCFGATVCAHPSAGMGDTFEGSFNTATSVPTAGGLTTNWDWNGFPAGPATQHPANRFLHYSQQPTLDLLKPAPVHYVFIGGETPGGRDKKRWTDHLEDEIDNVLYRRMGVAAPPTPAQRTAAEAVVIANETVGYPAPGGGGGPWQWEDLRLEGPRLWQAHHIHENSWQGSQLPINFQYLQLRGEHSPLSTWWNNRRTAIFRGLHII